MVLTISPYDDETWLLEKDYVAGMYGIVVPKGFRTDLASTPRIIWWLLPPFGRYIEAAVVHDYLYRMGGERKAADKIFYRLMRWHDVPRWKAGIMYLAVRMFGWVAY